MGAGAAAVAEVGHEARRRPGRESALRSSRAARSSPRWAQTTAWKQLSQSHCHGYVVGFGTQ